jgi:hypothetical protein
LCIVKDVDDRKVTLNLCLFTEEAVEFEDINLF